MGQSRDADSRALREGARLVTQTLVCARLTNSSIVDQCAQLKFRLRQFKFRSRHIRNNVFENAQPKRTSLACDLPELRA